MLKIFDFYCPQCDLVYEHLVTLEDREAGVFCDCCETIMENMLSPTNIDKYFEGSYNHEYNNHRNQKC